MAANEIHIADIGTIFEVTLLDDVTPVDVSSASVMKIIFEKPDKTIVENVAVFKTDGVDGKIQYTVSSSSELDQKGNWKIQANVLMPVGHWSSDIDKFKVHENL